MSSRTDTPFGDVQRRQIIIRRYRQQYPFDKSKAAFLRLLPYDTLIRFSEKARRALTEDPSLDTFYLPAETNRLAANILCLWMYKQDHEPHNANVEPLLSPTKNGDVTFTQCVNFLHACHMFKIPRELRGTALRKDVTEYLEMAPLRFDEFAMIVELLDCHLGLVQMAIDWTRIFKEEGDNGIGYGVPDWDKILKYAREMGIEEPLLRKGAGWRLKALH